MQGVVQKWGNSNAIRLPKQLLESVGLKENDPVVHSLLGADIVISKATVRPPHKTLKQRLAESGVSADCRIEATETDAASVGDEVFW